MSRVKTRFLQNYNKRISSKVDGSDVNNWTFKKLERKVTDEILSTTYVQLVKKENFQNG